VQWVVDLGQGDASLQRVLTLDAVWFYAPTWETDAEGNVTRRPPHYEGVTLGGLDRMRGFESNRFHDKAGVGYGAEHRVIPEWQPIPEIGILDWARIQYWQWALFAEAGQVGPSWDLADLHGDPRFDVGISLRGMLHKPEGVPPRDPAQRPNSFHTPRQSIPVLFPRRLSTPFDDPGRLVFGKSAGISALGADLGGFPT